MSIRRPSPKKGKRILKKHPAGGGKMVPLQQGNIASPPTGPASANSSSSVSATGGTGGTVTGA